MCIKHNVAFGTHVASKINKLSKFSAITDCVKSIWFIGMYAYIILGENDLKICNNEWMIKIVVYYLFTLLV